MVRSPADRARPRVAASWRIGRPTRHEQAPAAKPSHAHRYSPGQTSTTRPLATTPAPVPLFTTAWDRGSAGGDTVPATAETSAGLAAPAPLPATSARRRGRATDFRGSDDQRT